MKQTTKNYNYFRFNTSDSPSLIAKHLGIELSEVSKMANWQEGMQLRISHKEIGINTFPVVLICEPLGFYEQKIGKGWFTPDSKHFFGLHTTSHLDVVIATMDFILRELPYLEGLLKHLNSKSEPDAHLEDLERYEAYIAGLKEETLWQLYTMDFFYYDPYSWC